VAQEARALGVYCVLLDLEAVVDPVVLIEMDRANAARRNQHRGDDAAAGARAGDYHLPPPGATVVPAANLAEFEQEYGGHVDMALHVMRGFGVSREAAMRARDDGIRLVIAANGLPVADRDLRAFASRHRLPFDVVRRFWDQMERGA
jgi:hypothetical protein